MRAGFHGKLTDMKSLIEFYFDFSSPYGYVASAKIDALAARHGREVLWRPYLLGVPFKKTGIQPLVNVPMKAEYSLRDFARNARFHGLEYRHPTRFPTGAVPAVRAYYWLEAGDRAKAKAFARALFRAYFVEDRDISDPETTVAVAGALGLGADAVRAALADDTVKNRTREAVDEAVARGAFGSPFFIVEGEPFWGSDRMDQLERWIAAGGW